MASLRLLKYVRNRGHFSLSPTLARSLIEALRGCQDLVLMKCPRPLRRGLIEGPE